jgi:hypothetical protein
MDALYASVEQREALRSLITREASDHGESVWSGKTEPHEGPHGVSLNELFIKCHYKPIAYMLEAASTKLTFNGLQNY